MKTLLLFFAFLFSAVPVVAPEAQDSLRVPAGELALVKEHPEDVVIKRWYLDPDTLCDFDWSDMTSLPENAAGDFYLVFTKEPYKRQDYIIRNIINGVIVQDSRSEDILREFYKTYALHPEAVFGDSVIVNHLYCINVLHPSGESMIWYSTNQGDFVLLYYVMHKVDGNNLYLLPYEEYLRIKPVQDERFEMYANGQMDGVHEGLHWVEDLLLPYVFTPRDRDAMGYLPEPVSLRSEALPSEVALGVSTDPSFYVTDKTLYLAVPILAISFVVMLGLVVSMRKKIRKQ